MLENPILLLSASTVLAAIPIAIWLYITIKSETKSKWIMLLVFALGCLTAPALLGLQFAWDGGTPLAAFSIPILTIYAIVTNSSGRRLITLLLLGICLISLFFAVLAGNWDINLPDSNIIQNLKDLWNIRLPDFNLSRGIEENISSLILIGILDILLFVVMEENIKLYVIRAIDRKSLYITKVNDTIRFSIASALGFSFGENIYYLYAYWPDISTGQLAGMFFFRSIFTTAAHMVYTGVFGYYYGIGKFSMFINKQNKISGAKDHISKLIAKIFNLPPSEAFRHKMILKGLFIAMGMHFTINYLLQLQEEKGIKIFFPIVLISNILMYLYLQHLLNRKSGNLILLTDPTTQQSSSMGKNDKDVVIDLLAMWFKDRRYVDVIHICERLLERDPDNKVVQIFKAKAVDAMDDKNVYREILGTVLKDKNELSDKQKNIISRYMEEKEIFQKVKQKIKERLKKEGKEFIETKITTATMVSTPVANQISSGDTFKLK